jgi:hypothetical protein
LLYNFQIDRKFKKSTINTRLLLVNKVQKNYLKSYKISILFLDIKGTFNYISKNQFLTILKRLKLLISLIT